MATKSIDLTQLFGSVVNTMVENKESLNQADTYNHDHGTNMVEIFDVITKAMQEKNTATPSERLAYASNTLQAKSQSGSAKLYAEGLQKAAVKMQGKKTVTPDNAVTLLQALMGTQSKVAPKTLQSQAQTTYRSGSGADLLGALLGGAVAPQQQQSSAPASGDLLGSLLGGLMGAPQQQQQPASQGTADLLGALLGGASQTTGAASNADPMGDMLGSLLGGLTGTGTSSSAQSGKIDIGKLLKAGVAYMAAKQSGSSGMEAILQAVMAGSRVGNQGYRAQSGTLVASSILQALAQMSK